MKRYTKGDDVSVYADFTDRNGALINPTAVTCKTKNPAGAIVTYVYGADVALVRESTGKYRLEIAATISGRWTYRFEASGVGMSAGEGQFFVENSLMD